MVTIVLQAKGLQKLRWCADAAVIMPEVVALAQYLLSSIFRVKTRGSASNVRAAAAAAPRTRGCHAMEAAAASGSPPRGRTAHCALTMSYAGLLQVLPDVRVRFTPHLSCAVICEPNFSTA